VRRVRREGSYIYEEFMPTGGTDVKVWQFEIYVFFFFFCVDDYISVFSDTFHVCPKILTSQIVLKKFNQ
jgi:hypothetical protein